MICSKGFGQAEGKRLTDRRIAKCQPVTLEVLGPRGYLSELRLCGSSPQSSAKFTSGRRADRWPLWKYYTLSVIVYINIIILKTQVAMQGIYSKTGHENSGWIFKELTSLAARYQNQSNRQMKQSQIPIRRGLPSCSQVGFNRQP